ncbi:MAG: hypothetical protein QCH99_02320 [Candidatus Bathyarchaeota archaeon]|nr:hypothetical protein [Candidatus Bathyarchaeum tardum]WGM89126.1 MAG: hypothetical protein NUK63_09460 [Candidatus Bathyarchaeum tardum]
MRNIIKSKKGISPILATLLLIVIAVAAVIVTYAWVITFTETTASSAGAILTVENVRFYTSGSNYVEIIVRNSGTADAKIDTVYVGDSASNLIQKSSNFVPGTQMVTAGSTLNVTIQHNWIDGNMYYFRMGTEEGISIPFNREA